MTSVRLEGVSKSFGTTVALRSIDLTIEGGELFFLLGPSGCGKSTLLRLIAGLHEPTGGRIYFNDRDVTALPTQERNAVMCFQSYALWPHMTVRQNIEFGLDVRKVPAAERARRVDEVLDLVKMTEYAQRKPNQLSGGQQQRVALARALAVRPACLLLDEPLSNLDAKLRLDMRGEIRRICRASGLTAIYVTHDQKEALSIADRMAVLNAGAIEQVGGAQEIYLRPRNRFIANFMGETNFIEGTVEQAASGLVAVRTEMGQVISSAAPPSLAGGTKVVLSIRPETIHLGEAPADAPNRFDGTVHHTLYLGEVAQHQVSVGGNGAAAGTGSGADGRGRGTTLKAFELNPRFVARDEATERADVWFEPKDVVVLTE